MSGTQKPILASLAGLRQERPPVWMMRQAGRHLPEYRALRSQAKNFLDFCYSPDLASEATLQPVRRYQMDGAILFADILLILDALGRKVRFEPGIGPIVEKISSAKDMQTVSVEAATAYLAPVYETVARVKANLPDHTALIGFAGSPWTVALYALEGRGKTDKSEARLWAHQRPEELQEILDILVEASAHYLNAQVKAGAEVLMLFDSWAEGLPDNIFKEIIIAPTRKLVKRLRALGVDVPIIGFPRGAGAMLPTYVDITGVSAVGLDTACVPDYVNAHLPSAFPVQGHLDPLLLIAGGEAMTKRVRELIAAYTGRPHIFNLGHGVLPQTPIENVERVLKLIREG